MWKFSWSGRIRSERCPRGTGRIAVAVSALVMVASAGLVAAGPVATAEGSGHGQQASSTALAAVDYAKSRIGKPYQWGGSGPDTFDCSGLVQWSYRQAGVHLPRTTYDQVNRGRAVSRGDLRPGDLLFFYSGPDHAGIYIGGGQFVHASSSGSTVQIAELSGYYGSNLIGARRVA